MNIWIDKLAFFTEKEKSRKEEDNIDGISKKGNGKIPKWRASFPLQKLKTIL